MPVDSQGNQQPFYGRRFSGRGYYGRPFGRGRGYRFRYFATGVPGRAWFGQPYWQSEQQSQPTENELKKQEIKELEQQLEEIKKRLAQLKE
jgi:hypothetical protein